MELLVRCPKCGHKMKYHTQKEPIGRIKKCVYCGKSFTINRERIID